MIPQGYKHTELGIIPQEWEICNFDKIVESFTGLTYSPNDIADKGVLVLRSSNIKDGTLCFDDNVFVQMDIPERAIVKTGDILVCVRNGSRNLIGKSAMITEVANNMAFGAFMTIFRVKPNFDNYYIHCLWQTNFIQKQVDANMGATINQITNNDIKRFKCPVPPVEEQRKIAEILGVWDKAIELQARLVDKLELRKRALMQSLLTGRLRLPGFSDPWQKVKLGDIGVLEKGYGVPKNKIITVGKKAITYGEIYTKYDFVIRNFYSYIDSITANESKEISCGAILFAGSGETLEDIGKCVAFIDNDVAYAGGDIIVFNPTIKVNSLLLSYILNSPSVNSQKREYGQGHSVVHIYAKDLSKIKLLLPPIEEQTAIAEVLSTADKEIEIAKAKLAAYRTQKRGLMQQLLTGKKRVK